MSPLPELIANSPVPGSRTALGTLTADPGSGGTSLAVSAAAPASLRATTGQFRAIVDSEIMLVTPSATGASPWTVARAQEGSTATAHAIGTSVYHYLTAGALTAFAPPLSPVTPSADYTAVAGDLVLMTGAHTVTLPGAPAPGTRVGVVALTGNVSINRNATPGTETIFNQGLGLLTTLLLYAGANVTLMFLAGVWYVIAGAPVGPAPWLALPSTKQLAINCGIASFLGTGASYIPSVTVAHGLGRTPSTVVCMAYNAVFVVAHITPFEDATNFYVQPNFLGTGPAFTNSATYYFDWIAIG